MLAKDIRLRRRECSSRIRGSRWSPSLALGLGIGVNTTVFTFVNAVLMRGLPFERPDEIFVPQLPQHDQRQRSGVSYPDYQDWRAQARSFAWLGGVSARDNEPQRQRASSRAGERPVGHGQHVQPPRSAGAAGTRFRPGRGPEGRRTRRHPRHTACGRRRYGSDPTVIGRPSRSTRPPARSSASCRRACGFPNNSDMWRPLVPDADLETRDARQLASFGRLASGVSRTAAQTELSGHRRSASRRLPRHQQERGRTSCRRSTSASTAGRSGSCSSR